MDNAHKSAIAGKKATAPMTPQEAMDHAAKETYEITVTLRGGQEIGPCPALTGNNEWLWLDDDPEGSVGPLLVRWSEVVTFRLTYT